MQMREDIQLSKTLPDIMVPSRYTVLAPKPSNTPFTAKATTRPKENKRL
jgi:hypothetical protein